MRSAGFNIILLLGSLNFGVIASHAQVPAFATEDSQLTCGLSTTTRTQRIAYLDARIASLTRSSREVTRNYLRLRSDLRAHTIAHYVGVGSLTVAMAAASAFPAVAASAYFGTYAGLARLAATVVWGAPASVGTGYAANRLLAVRPNYARGPANDSGYVFNGLAFPRVREFLGSEHCRYNSCAPEHPEFRESARSIESSHQTCAREFEAARPAWYVPELFSQSEAHRLAEVEIPYAVLVHDYLMIELEFYLRLKAALVLGGRTC